MDNFPHIGISTVKHGNQSPFLSFWYFPRLLIFDLWPGLFPGIALAGGRRNRCRRAAPLSGGDGGGGGCHPDRDLLRTIGLFSSLFNDPQKPFNYDLKRNWTSAACNPGSRSPRKGKSPCGTQRSKGVRSALPPSPAPETGAVQGAGCPSCRPPLDAERVSYRDALKKLNNGLLQLEIRFESRF